MKTNSIYFAFVLIWLSSCATSLTTSYDKISLREKNAFESGNGPYKLITAEEVLAKTKDYNYSVVKLIIPSVHIRDKSAILYRRIDSLAKANNAQMLLISLDFDEINNTGSKEYHNFPLSNYIISNKYGNDGIEGAEKFMKELGFKAKGIPLFIYDSNRNIVFSTYDPQKDISKIEDILLGRTLKAKN